MSSDFADALGEGTLSLGNHPVRGIHLPIEVVEPSMALLASLPALPQD